MRKIIAALALFTLVTPATGAFAGEIREMTIVNIEYEGSKIWVPSTIIAKKGDIGAWGAIADYHPAAMKAGNNVFDHNTYRVSSKRDDHWAWVDGFYDWTTYRQKSGQDANSMVVREPN